MNNYLNLFLIFLILAGLFLPVMTGGFSANAEDDEGFFRSMVNLCLGLALVSLLAYLS